MTAADQVVEQVDPCGGGCALEAVDDGFGIVFPVSDFAPAPFPLIKAVLDRLHDVGEEFDIALSEAGWRALAIHGEDAAHASGVSDCSEGRAGWVWATEEHVARDEGLAGHEALAADLADDGFDREVSHELGFLAEPHGDGSFGAALRIGTKPNHAVAS